MTSPRLDAESISGWRSMKCRTTRKPTTLIRARQHADGARREGSVLESKIEPVPQLLTGDYVYWIVYLAYVWQVYVRKAPKTCPLSGFSRRTCAIYKRETSGQDAKSAIYKPDIAVQFR